MTSANMFNKTLLITGLLLAFSHVFRVSDVYANENNELEVVAETSEEHPIVEIKAESDTTKPLYNTKISDEKPIKMIVGGQSKDGVAKSITLPVKAK